MTSYLLITTMGPNGDQSVSTAYTVVGGGNAGGGSDQGTATAGSSATKTGKSPGLQTGEGVMTRRFGWEGVGVLVGAVGFAALM